MIFQNREHAGKMLAAQLKKAQFKNPVVFALPRGGIPIGVEVARALKAPLDVLVVRKIGYPPNPEFGIGAIGEGDVIWLDENTLSRVQVSQADLERTIAAEKREVARRVKKYRKGRALQSVKDATAIIVDDGLATGVTARVAARVLRQAGAREVIIAVPVCPPDSVDEFRSEVEELICTNRPHLFRSVGQFYIDFPQLSDDEVLIALEHFSKPVGDAQAEHRLSDLFDESEIGDETKTVANALKSQERAGKPQSTA